MFLNSNKVSVCIDGERFRVRDGLFFGEGFVWVFFCSVFSIRLYRLRKRTCDLKGGGSLGWEVYNEYDYMIVKLRIRSGRLRGFCFFGVFLLVCLGF